MRTKNIEGHVVTSHYYLSPGQVMNPSVRVKEREAAIYKAECLIDQIELWERRDEIPEWKQACASTVVENRAGERAHIMRTRKQYIGSRHISKRFYIAALHGYNTVSGLAEIIHLNRWIDEGWFIAPGKSPVGLER